MKKKFYTIGIIGVILICVLAFVLPQDPFEIIPAITMYSFDKPLWLCIVISGNFIYLSILYKIYNLKTK